MAHDYPPWSGGGLALAVRELAGIVAGEHHVTVLSARLRDHFADDRSLRLDAPFRVGGVRCLLRLIPDADILMAHWTFSFRRLATAAILLGPLVGVPTVVVVHTAPDHVRFNRLRRLPHGILLRLLRVALRRCAAVVAVTATHAAALREAGLPVTHVLPIPVSIARRPRRAHDGFVVGIAGEVCRLKGCDLLPGLVAVLPAGVRLRVAGDGPLLSSLRRVLPADRVEFLGRVDPAAMPEFYAGIDALLTLSRTETRPRVVVEAMLVGVPVVAPRAPWVDDLVVDDVTGALVEADDPESCSRRLADLAADPGLRQRLARAAEAARAAEVKSEAAVWRLLVGVIEGERRHAVA
jgi:glycosyltransferase involved in cell wall biosynthesis